MQHDGNSESQHSGDLVEQLRRYAFAGVPFAGQHTAFYERHLKLSPQRHAEAQAALDAIQSDAFSAAEPGIFRPLYEALMSSGDYYMHLADLQSYMVADQRMIGTYEARESMDWDGYQEHSGVGSVLK